MSLDKILIGGVMKFNDGVEINTFGEVRIIKLEDGYYVTGDGYLIPCENYKEAEEILKNFSRRLYESRHKKS